MIRLDVDLKRGDFHVTAAWDSDARVSGLFGPTGSGKTTILLALAGLLTPERGRIEVGGTVLFDSADNVNLAPEHRRVGVVFQDGRLFPHLDVGENLRFPKPSPVTSGPGFDEVVALLDLEPLLTRRIDQISGGQARLVAIGRALLSHPRLLLLDEPMTGLDARLRRRVLAYLLRLKESLDVRMMLVSHHFSDFLALVEEMAVLGRGALETVGAPDALMETALGREDSGRVETTLAGTVVERDGDRAVVECKGTRFELYLENGAVGGPAYLTVDAEDVLLAVGDVPRTSARNTIRGRVARVNRAGSKVLVGIDAGCLIWAEVTPQSTANLGLEPGREVFALVKASALRGVAPGSGGPSAGA